MRLLSVLSVGMQLLRCSECCYVVVNVFLGLLCGY